MEERKKLNKVKIRIRYIDYQTDTIKINFQKDINFDLESKGRSIFEVLVPLFVTIFFILLSFEERRSFSIGCRCFVPQHDSILKVLRKKGFPLLSGLEIRDSLKIKNLAGFENLRGLKSSMGLIP
ncbi:hypothetical protein [Pedobacter jeongneungensis]|uniref:hypothetical protein n=1 Tax=Pedobacter jeongneungensis TaxID=947309 RepID=UPI0031F01392